MTGFIGPYAASKKTITTTFQKLSTKADAAAPMPGCICLNSVHCDPATGPLIGSLIQLLQVVPGLVASYVLFSESSNLIRWVGTVGLMTSLYFLTQSPPKSAVIPA